MVIALDINVIRDSIYKIKKILRDKMHHEIGDDLSLYNLLELIHPQAMQILLDDYILDIFGFCPNTQKNIFINFKAFIMEYNDLDTNEDKITYIITSNDKYRGKSAALYFLSKNAAEPTSVLFTEDLEKILDSCDYFITENPNYLEKYKELEKIIKFTTFYNKDIETKYSLESFDNIKQYFEENILKK